MKKSTKFAHSARPKITLGTSVNPAIVRASTLLFDKADDLYNGKHRIYGRQGSELHDYLEEAFCLLEGGTDCALTPSGKSANILSLLSFVKSGDHVLISDSAYGPVRHFAETFLSRMGIETEFFRPDAGAELEEKVRDTTSVIALESPGSLSMEIQDLPAICAFARKRGIVSMVDNTWSAGLVYNPLKLGADVVVHSATKYFGGHSDVLYGAVITADKALGKKVKETSAVLGNNTSPDDTYTVLRGFRTITTRFEKQVGTALALAEWMTGHDKVACVLHPALPSHPQHARWQRDFTGSGALFSFVLKPCAPQDVVALLDRLHLFAKGFSFGGYESLVIHCDPQLDRAFAPDFGGPLIRVACGLEDIDDLQQDWARALETLKPGGA